MMALGFFGEHLLDRHGRRHDLAVDVAFAYPTRDQLRVLRAEVHDENGVERALGSTGNGHVTAFQRRYGDRTTASVVRCRVVERRERQQGTGSAAGSPLYHGVAGAQSVRKLTSADA